MAATAEHGRGLKIIEAVVDNLQLTGNGRQGTTVHFEKTLLWVPGAAGSIYSAPTSKEALRSFRSHDRAGYLGCRSGGSGYGRTVRPDIIPGGTFPDYALPDQTGTVRRLSELQGRDPLILTLARGNYCPKEHQQHLELAANYPKIAVAYTQVATIATDDHHTLQEFRASVGAQWTFLSDPGRTVQQDLDIQEYTDPEHNPMIPHTLVLKPGLIVHSVYNGYWFWGRPSFSDLWHDLRVASSEIRPDWDLSAPGLRQEWEKGDFSHFHGWDRKSPGAMPTSYVEASKSAG